jgi:chromosome partitioning protein
MTQLICMFNHKGGVSKTTTSYHLGWMLANKGKRVVLVDADPQCNLTNVIIGEDEFEKFYVDFPERNLKAALSPAFRAKPVMLDAVECVLARGNGNLFLLPGSFELSEYEVSLGISLSLSEAMITLKNLPGSFAFLFKKTADRYRADYVIVDLNPSLSAINQALLLSCNYFILPTAPDKFSTLAIRSLSQVLPQWEKWGVQARKIFADASYPLPGSTPKFLGTVIQRFNIRKGKPTQASQEVIDGLCEVVKTCFVQRMEDVGMMLAKDRYEADDFCLARISDFQTLNPAYQTNGIPVFALSDDQLGFQGVVLQQYQQMRDHFYTLFSDFADRVIRMTNIE